MTPEEIQQARELAEKNLRYPYYSKESKTLARAVLALTEQQPEPASRDELVALIDKFNGRPGRMLAELSRYTITRKPSVSAVGPEQQGGER